MRDKLIELIDNNKACDFEWECNECEYYDITPCFAGRMADALIANGVRFASDNNVGDKPMTNGDRIRAMSDEELAEFLNRVKQPCDNCQLAVVEGACTETLCDDAMEKWLKQPCEVET